MIRGRKTPAGLCALIALVGAGGCSHYSPVPLSLVQVGAPVLRASDLPSDMTSDQRLRLALSRDPGVAAARAHVQAAEYDRKVSTQLPALSASLSTEYSKDADASHPWLYGGTLGIPLDTGVRRGSRVTSADIAVLKARYALADTIWGVRQRLDQAEGDVSFAGMRIALTQRLLDQRQAVDAHAKRLVHSGEETQAILVQARLDTSAAMQARLQAESQFEQARIALARALNTDVASLTNIPDWPEMIWPDGGLPESARIKTLRDRALYARGDIATAVSDYENAENDLHLAVAQQYPDITLSPGYTWERGVVKIPLGLSLTLPPLDGNRAHIEAAQSHRLAAGKDLEDRVRTVQADIDQAVQTWRSDMDVVDKIQSDNQPMSLSLAQRALRRVQAGDLDQGALLMAQIAQTQSELSLLQARQTLLNDRLKLEAALHQSLGGDDEATLKYALSEGMK